MAVTSTATAGHSNNRHDLTTIGVLETDLMATIFSYLCWNEILNAGCTCRKWKEAALATPVEEIFVRNGEVGRDLEWIARAWPNTQSFKIDFSTTRSEEFDIADLTHLRIFSGLKHLALIRSSLHGTYPFVFNFHNLLSLDLLWDTNLIWDLEMLSGLPNLQKLYCPQNHCLTGDLRSVKVLSRTLTELTICFCPNVTGSLDDLYDFPLLEKLDINGTKVTGDVRTITPNDLVSLKELELCDGVYGGGDMQTTDEAPSVMYANYQLMKRTPDIFDNRRWKLANNSPERYEVHCHHSRKPPFWVEFVKVGPRMGWRWTNCVCGGACEIHWLDPAPSPSDETYEDYCETLEDEEKREVEFFKGFLKPPKEEEYTQRAAEVPLDPILAQFSSRSSWGFW